MAFLRRLHVNQIDALEAAMATIAAHVEALGAFAPAVELILSIPGSRYLSTGHRLGETAST